MLSNKVISLIPVDRSKLERIAADGVKVPQPSIEHTIVKCDTCGEDGWIGPAQYLRLNFHGGQKLCYYCLAVDMADGADFAMHPLDYTADAKPRRV